MPMNLPEPAFVSQCGKLLYWNVFTCNLKLPWEAPSGLLLNEMNPFTFITFPKGDEERTSDNLESSPNMTRTTSNDTSERADATTGSSTNDTLTLLKNFRHRWQSFCTFQYFKIIFNIFELFSIFWNYFQHFEIIFNILKLFSLLWNSFQYF